MKPVVRLKYFTAITGVIIVNCLQFSLSEIYVSLNKAKITPVRLIETNFRNFSSLNRKYDSVIGSAAKISRVIPLKQAHGFKKNTKPKNSTINRVKQSENLSRGLNVTALIQGVTQDTVKSDSSTKKLSHNGSSDIKELRSPPTSQKQSSSTEEDKKNRIVFLTEDSWNHLNSLATDQELQDAVNNISVETISKATNVSATNPAASQAIFYTGIMNQIEKLNPAKMLKLENEIVNMTPGVRLNAHKRPILNIIPLEKISHSTKIKVHNKLSGSSIRRASSTLTTNTSFDKEIKGVQPVDRKKIGLTNPTILNDTASQTSTEFTTPSLEQVLPEPDTWSPQDLTTTFSPYEIMEGGFIPVIPDNGAPTSDIDHIEDFVTGNFSASVRKPRGPTKEGDYQLPSITTTSTAEPEVPKGYQTITEETTPGPKVIWYNHNQTPEDTFYPNSDNFLMPPEETSLEIITSIKDINGPIRNDAPPKRASSSFTSSEVMHSPPKQHKPGSRRRQKYRVRGKQKGKRVNKNFPLQPAETLVEHEGVSFYYDDRQNFHKSKGSGMKHAYRHQHESKRNYPSYDTNDLDGDIKDHVVIIPSYQEESVEKPYGNDDDDSPPPPVKYVVVNEYHDNYQDTRPPPPPLSPTTTFVYNNELSPYSRRPDSVPPPSKPTYYPREPQRPTSDGYGHGYREEPGTGDSDLYRRPFGETAVKPKGGWGSGPVKGGPTGGWGHGHVKQGPTGGWRPSPAGNYDGQNGWKDSKDFFSKAKDYFKNSDFSTVEKWFDVSIGVLAFLAFGGYIIMLLYQVFAVSYGRPLGNLFGRSLKEAGEMLDEISKGPMGQRYMDELEFIVKRAMSNVKRIWMTNSFVEKEAPPPKLKGEVGTK